MEFNSKSNLMGILRRITVAMMFLLALPALGFAQKIVGTVTDEQGEPLIGATIMVEGTKVGSTTDIDGHYSVNARKGQALVFSFVGMDTQKVKVGNSSVIDIVLKQNAANLDEVIVVGYGKQKKSSLTGAVSAIKGDELTVAPTTQLTQMLAGKVAGISSIQTSGEPGLTKHRSASVVLLRLWLTSLTVCPVLSTKSTPTISQAFLS